MSDDLRDDGTLRRSTAALMWIAYTGHATATFLALARRPSLPLPAPVARTTGSVITIAGAALLVAGMRRFTGVGELTGTNAQPLVTSGIYRYSRNPQYLGYIVTLAGLALTRRSAPALCSVAVLAAAYAAWVPMEEDHLNRALGEPYTAYQQQTHRWWGGG